MVTTNILALAIALIVEFIDPANDPYLGPKYFPGITAVQTIEPQKY